MSEQNDRISELKKLHVMSKPEFALAVQNIKGHIKKNKLDIKTHHIVEMLLGACRSYADVIDELFTEIERKNEALKRIEEEFTDDTSEKAQRINEIIAREAL